MLSFIFKFVENPIRNPLFETICPKELVSAFFKKKRPKAQALGHKLY